MKNFNLFVGLFLVVLFTTNCKKDYTDDNGIIIHVPSVDTTQVNTPRPFIDSLSLKYVGNWKLIDVTDLNGGQLYFSDSLCLDLRNDLYVDGLLVKGTVWSVVNNNELKIYQYPNNKYSNDSTYAVKNIFEIMSLTSTTLILSNYSLVSKFDNILYKNIYYFEKQ